MEQTWRFIPLLQASGTMQMAIDSWLLQQHLEGKQPSILRFYTWAKPTVSLGYHQRHYPDFWNQLVAEEKIDLVRRPTGGRAVLHQDDLTYMVITSNFSGKRVEVYQQFCKFLIEGWRRCNVELLYGTAGRGYIHNPNCFGTATGADLITSQGDKLIGSAQLKKGSAILQHGSMRLSSEMSLYSQVFQEPLPPLSLPTVSPNQTFIQRLIEALKTAACESFDINLLEQPLSTREWDSIQNSQFKKNSVVSY